MIIWREVVNKIFHNTDEVLNTMRSNSSKIAEDNDFCTIEHDVLITVMMTKREYALLLTGYIDRIIEERKELGDRKNPLGN
ncbi:hypothetical protein ACFL40_04425 [candidate division KSB1 bacterium]